MSFLKLNISFSLCFEQNKLKFLQYALQNAELSFTLYSYDAQEFKHKYFSRSAENL